MAFEGLKWCVVSTLPQVVSRWCRLRVQPISFTALVLLGPTGTRAFNESISWVIIKRRRGLRLLKLSNF
jgi:hypothetical protein